MSKYSKDKEADKARVMRAFGDGKMVLIGGFGIAGFPGMLCRWLHESGARELVLVTAGCSPPEVEYQEGFANLIRDERIRGLKMSHVGSNPKINQLWAEKKIEVEVVPQGTLVERIRAGGYGLGGVITPSGVGTPFEDGKQTIEIKGRKFLVEEPIHADIALVRAEKADRIGNLVFRNLSRNFNTVMVTAADVVIVETKEIVEVGELRDGEITIPGIFVDMIVPIQGASRG